MQCRPCLGAPRSTIEVQPSVRGANESLPPLAPPHAAVFRALGARLESLGQSLTLYAGRQRHDQLQIRALLDSLDPRGNGSQIWEWSQIFEDPALGVASGCYGESQRYADSQRTDRIHTGDGRESTQLSSAVPPQPPPPPPNLAGSGRCDAQPTMPIPTGLPAGSPEASLLSENRLASGSEREPPKTAEVEQKFVVTRVGSPRQSPPPAREGGGAGRNAMSGNRSVSVKDRSTMSFMIRDSSGMPVLPPNPSMCHTQSTKNKRPPVMQRIDTFIGGVILCNAMVMAGSLDIEPNWPGWEAFEYLFLFIFFSEATFKARTLGIYEYFLGEDRYWNAFDTAIVSFGIFELISSIVTEITKRETSSDVGGFVRMVKIIRLTRLARVVRLLRYKIFTELKAMVLGVFSGLRVLFWAILLFFVFIFLIAIILRSSVGAEKANGDPSDFDDTFGRMPWAMFTLFRCFTDGCADHDGTPLQVHLYSQYGALFSLSYMACFLFVTIGLFNLIMAVFVDNVMESTRARRQMERAEDTEETERCLRSLVKVLIRRDQTALKTASTEHGYTSPLLSSLCQVMVNWVADFFRKTPVHIAVARAAYRHSGVWHKVDGIEKTPTASQYILVTPEIFNDWLAVPEFRAMLEVLEIASSNPRELFDVLDADMSGELTAEELVVGLMSLRGPAEKSYTVASLLCIRVVQTMLRSFVADADERHASLLYAFQHHAGAAAARSARHGLPQQPSAASLGLADVD